MTCSTPSVPLDAAAGGAVLSLHRSALLVAVAILALGAVGCGSSGGKSSSGASTTASSATSGNSTRTTTGGTSSTPVAAGNQTIAIQNFKFNPDPLTVKSGTKVTVAILDDNVPHSVTADDGAFDTGIFMKSTGPKTITLSRTGTFKYHCQVHSFMTGTIDVS
jgi:plastocyanin